MTVNPYEAIAEIPGDALVVVAHRTRGISSRMTANEAFAWLLDHQGQSVAYALTEGGYRLEAVPADRWSRAEAAALTRTAAQLMNRHDHEFSDRDRLTRENCGACCLSGYRPRGGWGDDIEPGPNYAGWERIYTQARRPILRAWVPTYDRSADEDTPYGAALRMDIATYGRPAVL